MAEKVKEKKTTKKENKKTSETAEPLHGGKYSVVFPHDFLRNLHGITLGNDC